MSELELLKSELFLVNRNTKTGISRERSSKYNYSFSPKTRLKTNWNYNLAWFLTSNFIWFLEICSRFNFIQLHQDVQVYISYLTKSFSIKIHWEWIKFLTWIEDLILTYKRELYDVQANMCNLWCLKEICPLKCILISDKDKK